MSDSEVHSDSVDHDTAYLTLPFLTHTHTPHPVTSSLQYSVNTLLHLYCTLTSVYQHYCTTPVPLYTVSMLSNHYCTSKIAKLSNIFLSRIDIYTLAQVVTIILHSHRLYWGKKEMNVEIIKEFYPGLANVRPLYLNEAEDIVEHTKRPLG